jgi:hypothetical protein
MAIKFTTPQLQVIVVFIVVKFSRFYEIVSSYKWENGTCLMKRPAFRKVDVKVIGGQLKVVFAPMRATCLDHLQTFIRPKDSG